MANKMMIRKKAAYITKRTEMADTVEKLGMYKTEAWEGGISVSGAL
jgi:hypothetical protein